MSEQHNSLIYIFFENMGGTLVHKDKICSWMKNGIQIMQLKYFSTHKHFPDHTLWYDSYSKYM